MKIKQNDKAFVPTDLTKSLCFCILNLITISKGIDAD